jgi:hypothetical protein
MPTYDPTDIRIPRHMFQRRHYRAIAAELAVSRSYISPDRLVARHALEDAAVDIACLFARDNPRFSIEWFLTACKSAPAIRCGPYTD